MKSNLKNFINAQPYISNKQKRVKKKENIGEIHYSEENDCF